MAEDGVDAIFEPKSVVLVGASRVTKNKVVLPPIFFRSLVHNMLRSFKGKTYVIDLSGRLGAGAKNLKNLPKKFDLAVLTLPPDLALKHLRKLVDRHAKAAVVISGGYRREQLERLMRETVKRGVRALGPNAAPGIINTSNGLCATIERGTMPKRGGIAVVSQGEGLGAAMLDWACFHGIGISKFASVGDRVDIDEADLVDYLSRDKDTKVICIYLGGAVRGGRKLFDALREAAKRKPVVALSRSMGGVAVERASWRGEILDAILRQAGAVHARDLEELFDAAIALAKQPPMHGSRVAVLSNALELAILAAEALHHEGLVPAKLSDEIAKQIKEEYPDAYVGDIINMSPSAKADCYEFVLKHALDDPTVDGAMVINVLKSCLLEPEEVRVVADVAKKFSNKPVVDVPMGGEDYVLVSDILKDTDIPTYSLPGRGARALKALYLYGQIKKKVET